MVETDLDAKKGTNMHRILHSFSIYVVVRVDSTSCTPPAFGQMFSVVQNLFLKCIFSFFFKRKNYKLSSSFTILAFQCQMSMSMNAKCAIKTAPSVNKSDF